MKVPALGSGYLPTSAIQPSITVLPLEQNKRPIGFTAWSSKCSCGECDTKACYLALGRSSSGSK